MYILFSKQDKKYLNTYWSTVSGTYSMLICVYYASISIEGN